MVYSINKREDFKILKELVSLKNQVNEVQLQDRLGEQNYHYDMKKLLDPLIHTNKDTSEKNNKNFYGNLY